MTSKINNTSMKSGPKTKLWRTGFKPMKRLDKVRLHQRWTLRKPKRSSWNNTSAHSSLKYHQDPKTWSETGRSLVFLLKSRTKTFSKKNRSSLRKKRHGGTIFWVRNKKRKNSWWKRLSWVPGVKISGKQVAMVVPAQLDPEVVESVATTVVLTEWWWAHSVSMEKTYALQEFTPSKVIKAGKVKMWLLSSREISMNTIFTKIKKTKEWMLNWKDKVGIWDRETLPLTEPSLKSPAIKIKGARLVARESQRSNTSMYHSNQRLAKNQRC